jgi:hypothetical protein
MDFRIRRTFPEVVVYCLTAACVVWSLGERISTGHPSEDSPAGWMHLSLPMKLGILDDPLAGWSVFGQPPVTNKMAEKFPEKPALNEPAGEETRLRKPPRFEMVGVLNAAEDLLYCFFDTNTRRWFWLAGGGENPDFEVSLSIVDGQPRLMQAGSELDFKMRAE